MNKTNQLFFLFTAVVIALLIPSMFGKWSESFQNIYLPESLDNNSVSNESSRYLNSYPSTGRNGISNNGSAQIWKDYPIYEVGSYKQITNNIRYPKNPDEGTCMPASMCNALYKDKKEPSPVVKPLGPAPYCPDRARVNYYDTDSSMLPFYTENNIVLY